MPFQYEHARPAVSADIVVLDRRHAKPAILLIQRLKSPFAGEWALPGGFMEINESLEETAVRELREETSLNVGEVQQIGAFSAVDRDPRGRVVTVAFLAELNTDQTAVAADDAKSVRWFNLDALPPLAFDHATIIQAAFTLETSK